MKISKKELNTLNAYFRAANYLSVGQLYLLDNPLLKESLKREHVKKKIVGHWGTVPGQNFIYTHLNYIIKKYNQDMKNYKFDFIICSQHAIDKNDLYYDGEYINNPNRL